MAINEGLSVHRFPQSKAVDAIRWLPSISAFDRFVSAAVYDPDTESSFLEVFALETIDRDVPELNLRDSWPTDSRISSLRCSASTVAVSTLSGSVHILLIDLAEGGIESEIGESRLHDGGVCTVDLQMDGRDCASVGEDGRVNLVSVGEGGMEKRMIYDAGGLVSYTAVRWGSSVEFATGGLGFGLQWWDQRKPGGPVSHLKGDWIQGVSQGIVHSLDVHPSRKHICLAGGSSGVVFAWDLRWQQQPVLLSGANLGGQRQSPCESEVWEIQYDSIIQPGFGSAPPSKILPVMICSEDGVLAVLEQGQDPIELLAEPCAINAFDIDGRNPSDVVCSLEWETIALILRPRGAVF